MEPSSAIRENVENEETSRHTRFVFIIFQTEDSDGELLPSDLARGIILVHIYNIKKSYI